MADEDEIDGEGEPCEFIREIECPVAANVSLLQAFLPYVQPESHVLHMRPRVQFAYDQMHIAVCERVARIARSDLEGSGDARDGE